MPRIERLTLSNGLNLMLCHAPWLTRSAAALRVMAGSHDAPPAWPGLAHFLEHLLFLGTERFSCEDGLMAFVQRHGGQLNASTRERATDYFFELAPAVFEPGLERLCDMLAHPRLAVAEQWREREVLHAEFIAWARDAESCHQHHLLQPLNPAHPLRGFHAGNRYSLPVLNPAFQRDLWAFHRQFYQGAQMTLCLSGPQSLATLRRLGERYGALFATGTRGLQRPAPPLLGHTSVPCSPPDPQRLHLLFACEDLPVGSDEAVAFLCHWLHGIEGFKATARYHFQGQLLLEIECHPASADTAARFFDWLRFFAGHWPQRVEQYRLLHQRQWQTGSALTLARHLSERQPADLSEPGQQALRVLLGKLSPDVLLWPVPLVTVPASDWPLPLANPFLQIPITDNRAVSLYLHWRLSGAHPALWRRLDAGLEGLREQARQAGVRLQFSAEADSWQLRLGGLQAPLLAVARQALDNLRSADSVARPAPALMPIRQLLKRLPELYPDARPSPAGDDVQALWSASRWTSLALDLNDHKALDELLRHMPGQPAAAPHAVPTPRPGQHWHVEPCESSEHALLLFCPTPSSTLRDEAAWRLLAHLLQAPFYQRLRVELQLGYAVFSSLRQLDGHTGLLFGVQSPATPVAELRVHIQAFIHDLPALIMAADLPAQRQALLDQLGMDDEQTREWQWQAHLAGRGAGYLDELALALDALDSDALVHAAGQLRRGDGGAWVIASQVISKHYRA